MMSKNLKILVTGIVIVAAIIFVQQAYGIRQPSLESSPVTWGVYTAEGHLQAINALNLLKHQITTYPQDVGGTYNQRKNLLRMIDNEIALVNAKRYNDALKSLDEKIIPYGRKVLNQGYLTGSLENHVGFSVLLETETPEGFSFLAINDELIRISLQNPNTDSTVEYIMGCGNCVSLNSWCKYLFR